MARQEHLYLLEPEALPGEGLMVTATLPAEGAAAALAEVDRFLGLLQTLYRTLGGRGLRLTKLREARLNTPRLALQEGERPDVPLERFVEVFTRWIAREREASAG